MHNTLTEPVVGIVYHDGVDDRLSLPEVLAALIRDDVAAFPALRAHQRHAWHAFLVQIGAMALHKAGNVAPPVDASDWKRLLLGLTTADQAETAWSLVAPLDRPALLQPPIPDGPKCLKNDLWSPDALDVLRTSKNHEIKQSVMTAPGPDDWLFSLVSLQTMDGFLGPGNHGISRMNGGFANRPAVGRVPPGGVGAHVRRDMVAMLSIRPDIVSGHGYQDKDGLCLVWVLPWDGSTPIKACDLDPFYVEICRRARLVSYDGKIMAKSGNSTAPRIVSSPGGVTGDPWAPLRFGKEGGLQVLTPSSVGFDFRRMVDFLFSLRGPASALQLKAEGDPKKGMRLLARALVRGQGITEGYHERSIPISEKQRFLGPTDPSALIAVERVELAAELQNRVLKAALLALVQNAPDKIDFKRDDPRIGPFMAAYERAVDLDFFEKLWIEADEDDAEIKDKTRADWVRGLSDIARKCLEHAESALPKVSHRHWKTTVRAQDVFESYLRANKKLKRYFEKVKESSDE